MFPPIAFQGIHTCQQCEHREEEVCHRVWAIMPYVHEEEDDGARLQQCSRQEKEADATQHWTVYHYELGTGKNPQCQVDVLPSRRV